MDFLFQRNFHLLGDIEMKVLCFHREMTVVFFLKLLLSKTRTWKCDVWLAKLRQGGEQTYNY